MNRCIIRKIRSYAAGIVLAVASFSAGPQPVFGQVAADKAVMLCASVETNPPKITLTWKVSTYGTGYVVGISALRQRTFILPDFGLQFTDRAMKGKH
jgi:hypothetical protein